VLHRLNVVWTALPVQHSSLISVPEIITAFALNFSKISLIHLLNKFSSFRFDSDFEKMLSNINFVPYSEELNSVLMAFKRIH